MRRPSGFAIRESKHRMEMRRQNTPPDQFDLRTIQVISETNLWARTSSSMVVIKSYTSQVADAPTYKHVSFTVRRDFLSTPTSAVLRHLYRLQDPNQRSIIGLRAPRRHSHTHLNGLLRLSCRCWFGYSRKIALAICSEDPPAAMMGEGGRYESLRIGALDRRLHSYTTLETPWLTEGRHIVVSYC